MTTNSLSPIANIRNIYVLFAAEDGCINQVKFLNKVSKKTGVSVIALTTNDFGAQHPFRNKESEENVMNNILGVEFEYKNCSNEQLAEIKALFSNQEKYLWNFSKIIIDNNEVICLPPWELDSLI